MTLSQRHALGLIALWAFLMAVSLFSRSYIPIDETRYVTVAWNMWLRGDFLVPYLNDIAYSHKPPLLFWMMQLGWAVFGVNDWWPRLVPAFFALGGVFLVSRIAALLWPGKEAIGRMASVILFGCLLWMVFATATMFDMMVAFFTLLGMLGVLTAWRGAAFKGWGIVGLAIGLGLLAKGPTILLQILPVAVLAPWWVREHSMAWGRWYAGILAAVVLGAAIALAWAIPAGMRGGPEYQHAIFWGQTADRMVKSFAHQRPFWWYFPLLPVMLFPWLLWGGTWRALSGIRARMQDVGVRFALAWSLPVFLAFCFISGKQVHYLLPIFPAFALLVACGLDALAGQPGRNDRLPVSLVILLVGVGVLALPYWAAHADVPAWLGQIPAYAGLALVVCGILFFIVRVATIERQVWLATAASLVMVLGLHLALIRTAGLAYDIHPISAKIKALQEAGVPLANVGKYHGQYQFIGRLERSIEQTQVGELKAWFDAHPDGRVIFYPEKDRDMPLGTGQADYEQPYLGIRVGIYSREALLPPSP